MRYSLFLSDRHVPLKKLRQLEIYFASVERSVEKLHFLELLSMSPLKIKASEKTKDFGRILIKSLILEYLLVSSSI